MVVYAGALSPGQILTASLGGGGLFKQALFEREPGAGERWRACFTLRKGEGMDRDEWEGRLLLLEPTIHRVWAVHFGLRDVPLHERNAFRTLTRRLRRVGERWPPPCVLPQPALATERAARGGGRLGVVFHSAEEQALIRQQATTLVAEAGAKSFRWVAGCCSYSPKGAATSPLVLVLRGVGKGRTVRWLQEWLRRHAYCHATALRGAELRHAQANTI